jgi:hypothetical protein
LAGRLYPDRGIFAAAPNLIDRLANTLGMPAGTSVRLREIDRWLGSVADANESAAEGMLASMKDWPLPERSMNEEAA